MPTGEFPASTPHARSDQSAFEPSLALSFLDDLPDGRPAPESAWEAAFIACLTGSPLWAETARRAFILMTAEVGAHGGCTADGCAALEASPGIEPGCKDLQSSA